MSVPRRRRVLLVVAVFLGFVGAVALRAVELAWVESRSLSTMAARQQRERLTVLGERGSILDREQRPLAMTVRSASIGLRPSRFQPTDEELASLGRALRLSPEEILRKARESGRPFLWLARNVSPAQEEAVRALGLEGIEFEVSTRRFYPHGDLGAQLLGFVGVDGQGLSGLELRYDELLRGEAVAVVVERDARGRRIFPHGSRRSRARPGHTLLLTIDASLQHAAEVELDRGVEEAAARAGMLLALDPRSGAILALAQVPRFNPNRPNLASPDAWRNRAVTDLFEPGSTFKPFVAAAALESGLFGPGDVLDCEGGRYFVGGRWIRDHEPRSRLTFAQVLQYSSNIGIAKIAGRLGKERVGDALRRFGFGRRTGVELPGEAPGLVPPARSWRPIRLATIAFGQGVAVTALQLVRAYAALANGGILLRPYVVDRIVDAEGGVVFRGGPLPEGRAISEGTARLVSVLLEGVVEGGTGHLARIPGVRVAGKTGTAQVVDPATKTYSASDRIVSFVGFAPAENPKIVVAVILDRPRRARYGGTAAAPVFRRFVSYALPFLGADPEPPPVEPLAPRELRRVSFGEARPKGGMPNLVGLSMRDAVRQLARFGLSPVIEGWGVVVAQDPPPGSDLPFGGTVRLQFGSQLD